MDDCLSSRQAARISASSLASTCAKPFFGLVGRLSSAIADRTSASTNRTSKPTRSATERSGARLSWHQVEK